MTKKYTTTKAQMFAQVIDIINGSNAENKGELIERINHEIELATKPRTSGEKAKEKEKADEALTNLILATLANSDKALCVSEIQAAEPKLAVTAGINTSKVTALITKAVNAEKVVKIKDKKKTLYTLPAEVEEEPAE